jgi:tetratricopeptide (TPR) repeat protein
MELGYLLINLGGRPPEAAQSYRRSLALALEGEAKFSDNLTFRQLAAFDYSLLGHALYVMGQCPKAEKAQRQALARWQDLAATEPIYHPTYRMGMASSHNDLADVLHSVGRLQEAEEGYRQALEISEKLVAEFPLRLDFVLPRPEAEDFHSSAGDANRAAFDDTAQYHSRLAAIHNNLAELLQNTGRRREAEESYRRALRVQQTLVDALPNVPDHQWLLALIHGNLGTLLWHANRHDEAKTALRRSLEIREKLATDFPKMPAYLLTLAGMLADCPDPGFRKPDQAVALANRAVEVAPEFAPCWIALGVASFRTGDDKSAVTAFEKVIQLREGGDSTDWFFLAMAHWRLGNTNQGRNCYAQAVTWMEKNKPGDEELSRFRVEAEELLGLSGGAGGKTKEN